MEKGVAYSRCIMRIAWGIDMCILGFKEEFLFCCGWTKEPEEVSEINDTASR